jgi:hypothetical protein
MSTINRLSSVDALQPGDLIPVWDGSNGDTRKASLTTLLAFIESNFADPDYSTRIVAPNVDGFNVDIGNTGDSSWLIVNPTLNYTTGSITLPSTAYAVNDQEITVVFTAQVSSFSITGAGATVLGAPTQIGTYDSFRVRYNAAQLTWYTLDTTGDGSGSGTSSIVRQQFTGDATTTTFTLANTPSALGESLQVFINGVYQERAGYSVSGNDLVFSEAPPVLSTIEVLAWGVNDIGATTANLVSYTPEGIGAVVTTVQSKLREVMSVKDFGAVGDGIADDTAALQAAIDYAALNAVALHLSKGIYRTTATLTIPQNITPGSAYGITLYGDNSTWARVSVIRAEHTGVAILSLKGSNGCRISGIKLESDPTTYPKCGMILGRDVNVDSCGWHNISAVFIDGFFSVAGIYSIASEENQWNGIFIQIQGGGAKYGYYSSVSDFLAVDSLPASSNVANYIHTMHIWNWQAIADSACIYLELGEYMGSFSFTNCYCIPKSGSFYRMSAGVLSAADPLGGFSFINCGGEIYSPVAPWLDTPLYAFRIDSNANDKIKNLNIQGGRCQMINGGGVRKLLSLHPGIELDHPNIVLSSLEDLTIGFEGIRNKIRGGIFDAADSSDWIPLTFSGAWGNNFGAPYAQGEFQVDPTGVLRLRGTVNNGGAGISAIAQLPPGYEPQYTAYFSTSDSGALARILVQTTGAISMIAGTGTELDLNGVAFKLVDP